MGVSVPRSRPEYVSIIAINKRHKYLVLSIGINLLYNKWNEVIDPVMAIIGERKVPSIACSNRLKPFPRPGIAQTVAVAVFNPRRVHGNFIAEYRPTTAVGQIDHGGIVGSPASLKGQ